MTDTPTIPPFVNNTMKFVLRSPLQGIVSKSVLLISFTGCKSGKTYTTPVSYSEHNGMVTIFTHASWWKNLCGSAPVNLRIRGKDLRGIAETVDENKQAIAAGLTEHLRRVPSDARYYGVTMDAQGKPNPNEVFQAVQTVVMIRVTLTK
jgi:hypothetical protein